MGGEKEKETSNASTTAPLELDPEDVNDIISALKGFKKYVPDIDERQIQPSDTIHVNINKIVSQFGDSIEAIFEIIETIRSQGVTVLLVEQNANQALRIADRGYVLEGGEVLYEDSASALLADDRVRRAYLGGE